MKIDRAFVKELSGESEDATIVSAIIALAKTLNLKVVQTDVARGLILVEGAVPGHAGGWIYVRDAVKKALPKDVPMPGKFRVGGESAANETKQEG